MAQLSPIKHMPQPAIILDKSAFQSLSRDEHAERLFRFQENVTPILLHEILADLGKADPRRSSEAAVQILADKFLGSGGVINADHRVLCAGDLTGRGRFDVDGRPVLGEYSMGREPGGTLAVLVEPTAGNKAIMRWAAAQFSEKEKTQALSLRAQAGSFGVDALYGRLRQHHVLLPRPRNIAELKDIGRDLLVRRALQPASLEWLVEQLRLPSQVRELVAHRWNALGRPLLSEFAPYAFHCTRVLLLLLVGMRHGVLSARKTNRLDVEYLFYLPFCEKFISGDKLHAQLAPMILADGQTFVAATEFKAEMAKLVAERRAARSHDER